jgi:ornithine cyclodeaminase
LLLMPAWRPGGRLCVKIASVYPDNSAARLAPVQALVLLADSTTGAALALPDGKELTLRRTAAASALAARYLASPGAAELLMVGTGALAPHLVAAHCEVRPIRNVQVWGRTPERARACADVLASRLPGVGVSVASDVEAAARSADIVSCATTTTEPIIRGRWLKVGAHLDLVGAYLPETREADSDAIARGRLFVDTYEGAQQEAGDILIPMQEGRITFDHVRGDLRALVEKRVAARSAPDEITIFKSVGCALEDLAAAELALERHLAAAERLAREL